MVRPYHSLSLLSLLFGRFRYCIMYLVCCIRLRLSWDLSAPYVPLFLGCESRWDSCVNHIPDRDGRGCGRCQTVWFSIFSCRHGRTSRIDFVFFFFLFFPVRGVGSACHVSDVWVQGLGLVLVLVTVQWVHGLCIMYMYALHYVFLVVILGLDAGNIHEH